MRKKIAVVVACNIHNRKGLFNSVHQRILHLKSISSYPIDAFILSSYIPDYILRIRRTSIEERPDFFSLDGIDYHVLWFQNSLIDYFLVHKLKLQPFFRKYAIKRFIPLFKDYSLICVHSGCNDLGFYIKSVYRIPYIQTWHGSDIHTVPFQSKSLYAQTADFIRFADFNIFVSAALKDLSEKIALSSKKTVIYNGKSSRYISFPLDTKLQLKKQYGAEGKSVVGFVGNLIDIKNTRSFPGIFRLIYEKMKDNVVFWIIGNGPNQSWLKKELSSLPVVFWGAQPQDNMPGFMNSMDVLILPSINEGLPLTTVEALACGCHVVGSRVGGIPESIGIENTIDLLEPDFESRFASRVLFFLEHKHCIQKLDDKFDWDVAASLENSIINELINKNA